MVRVLVPVGGGINDKSKRQSLNMLSKIPASNENMSDDARTLSGLVRSDPRVDPMEGELDFMRGLMTYNLADQNEGCLDVAQMQPGMIAGPVMNAQRDLGTSGMRARSLPGNGNEPGMAWTGCDIKNFNAETVSKSLRGFNNWEIALPPPFPKPKVNMVA
tara:strand:+ start:2827 stop:3306 length:480 start_codon:yes stop_codon:yes gene_type:complete